MKENIDTRLDLNGEHGRGEALFRKRFFFNATYFDKMRRNLFNYGIYKIEIMKKLLVLGRIRT